MPVDYNLKPKKKIIILRMKLLLQTYEFFGICINIADL